MAAAASFPVVKQAPEQRMLLSSVSYAEYVRMREALEGPSPRMTFLRGALELMSPSPEHELWKTNIARFVEHFAFVRNIPLHGYGSTTFKKEALDRGAEPDECYLVGKTLAEFPEIVVEVIFSSPLLNKLEVYRPMGVREVWVFEQGRFVIFQLGDDGAYAAHTSSALLPTLDFERLATFVTRTDTPVALREFDAELRAP